MASMIDSLRSFITPAAVSRAAAQTGESEAGVAKGLDVAVPAIVGALAHRSDDRPFISQLSSLASNVPADSDPMSYAKSFGPPPSTGLDIGSTTGTWLSTLFGRHLDGVMDSISRYAGIRRTSAGALLSMAAPLVIGYLGRVMRTENLDAAGLANRLRGEKRHLASALPVGLDLPGLGLTAPSRSTEDLPSARAAEMPSIRAADMPPEPAHVPPPVVPTATRGTLSPMDVTEPEIREPRTARPSSSSWAVPLVLGMVVLVGLLWWASRDRTEPAQVRMGDDTAIGTTGIGADRGETTVRQTVPRTLPGNVELRMMPGSTEDRMARYMDGGTGPNTFVFDRVAFEPGTATLASGSHEQIRNVATVIRAYPDMRVAIAAQPPMSGDRPAEGDLSRARAQTVAAALRDSGVPPNQIDVRSAASRPAMPDTSAPGTRDTTAPETGDPTPAGTTGHDGQVTIEVIGR